MTTAPETLSSPIADAIPAHVPPALVRDFDYLHAQKGGDLYAWWGQLNDGPDIFFTPRNGGHWVLTRHTDIGAVMSNPADFSSRTHTLPEPDKPFRLAPIEYDPPLHTDFRRLIAPFFQPKAMRALEEKALELTTSLIDGFVDKGQCDFVADYALIMPIGIFMGLVNLPDEDRLFLIGRAELIVRGSQEQQADAFREIFGYLGQKFAERRENLGDDILSAVIRGEIEGGRPLTDTELLGMGALLLVGGLDTVASMMGFIAIHLAENDADRRRLVEDPGLINTAVEELMRRYQIANVAREVTRDMVFQGVTLKEGDKILTPTTMAGLDDREYDDPMKVDFDRANKRSLVFGKGPHQCVGAYLARTELRIFLHEWLKRIPEFHIKRDELPMLASGRANSVQTLILEWDVTAR